MICLVTGGTSLAFGTDGYLYIGMGDGGSSNDPQNHAQNPNQLLGKMLRIDVSVADSDPNGYRVPTDNPFVDGAPIAALPEIWAFGLRNPWRFSFDKGEGGTGALVVADVGQGSYEEINYEPRGGGGRNYGWRIREGAHVNGNVAPQPPAYEPLSDPVFEYDHSVGRSISGGFVYRGAKLGSASESAMFSLILSMAAYGPSHSLLVHAARPKYRACESTQRSSVDRPTWEASAPSV